MGVVTTYKLSEQILNLLEGDDLPAGSSISYDDIKVTIGQVINAMLKAEYFSVNLNMAEVIPNGSILAFYEGIEVETSNGKSQCTLPIKPIKLPRNMGVWGVYPRYEDDTNYEYDKEFIPLQMGQGALIKSQPMINNLLGQVGYECFGNKLFFTQDIKGMFPNVKLAMRLAVMDINQYGDYDSLPVTPEMEIDIINTVVKMYGSQPTPDKIVDSSVKELKGVPINQQKQPE